MKYLLIALALPAFMSENCKNKNNSQAVPACIQAKIDSIKAQPKWNPPAEVNEYTYQGKTVYLFSSNCCDQFNTAWDKNCNYICAPSGGFTGKGDGKCADFNSAATHVKLVWKDPR